MGPDWSLLPPEMLQLISEKIISMDHYVYFRSVCQPWRQACTPHPRHLIAPFPWLVFFLAKDAPSVYTLSFYDFSKSRMLSIEVPGVNCKDVRGHSCGWIVLEKDKELSFVNPITRELKSGCFPSFAVPPTVLEFARNEKTTNPRPSDGIYDSFISKIILTSSPSDKDCIAVAKFSSCSEWELGFSRIGDACWTILKLREYGDGSQRMADFKCRNNSVYVISDEGCLTLYDLRDLSKKIIIDNLTHASRRNRLRLVLGEGEFDGVPIILKYDAAWFEILKCDNEAGGYKWKRVKYIGDAVVLLNGSSYEIVSLGNIRLNGWERNHICYYVRGKSLEPEVRIKIVSIDSVKKAPTTLGVFPSATDASLSWFTPSLY